jgi:hypothetical protein
MIRLGIMNFFSLRFCANLIIVIMIVMAEIALEFVLATSVLFGWGV